MRYLTLSEALELHRRVVGQSGGALGILNLGALESALAQPRMTFGGKELYPFIEEKAAALGHSLIQNHPVVDVEGQNVRIVTAYYPSSDEWEADLKTRRRSS